MNSVEKNGGGLDAINVEQMYMSIKSFNNITLVNICT